MTVPGISSTVASAPVAEATGSQGGGGFLAALREAVEKVNGLQAASGEEIRRLVAGETEDLHKTLLAVQRAELAFELMLEVRNKVVQAYQEVMRAPV
jgi:flagellar hook-basal body complex protein FliE